MTRPTLIFVALLVVGVVAINVLLSQTDLMLYLRTQVAPETGDPSVTKTFTWTPPNDTTPGPKTLTIEASDGTDTTTKEVTIEVLPADAATISNVVVTPNQTDALIAFNVSRLATKADIDVDAFTDLRQKINKADNASQQAYAITLTNLLACTNYKYKINAEVPGTSATSSGLFATTGCPGNTTITAAASADITASAGGSVTLSGTIVTLPANALSADANVQIKQIPRDELLAAAPLTDAGFSPISAVFVVDPLTSANTTARTLNQAAQVTLAFTPAADTKPDTITMYRLPAGSTSWQPLTDCSVDTNTNSVTCPTSEFSTFGVFGQGGGTTDPTPSPTPEQQQQSSSGGDSGGGGGGGGGGDGGGDEPAPAQPKPITYTLQVEQGHAFAGSYSGVEPSRKTAVLAHPGAFMERAIKVQPANYFLDIHVRHDKPLKPFRVAVYLNNRAWKVIKINNKGDNIYRTHRVGQLRNFRAGTIKFRLLDDAFDRNDLGNPDKDLNLHIDWWRLTTSGSAPDSVSHQAVGAANRPAGRSAGWSLLPSLNTYITQELGRQHVTFDIWQYYAGRLTLPTNDPAVIQTQDQLRSVMRYWKGIRPNRPRGD